MLLTFDRGTYHELDDVGRRIWELLPECTTVHEIAKHIVAEFDTDDVTAHSDIAELVAELTAAGLVVVDDRQPPAA